VRARLAVLPVVAALPFLSGCLWWGYGAGAAAGDSGTATVAPPEPALTDAELAVRSAVPAIEAYYADNGTYAGMTVRILRSRYDAGIPAIALVPPLNGETYCVEAPRGAPAFHKPGPAADVLPGPCPR
jgi:hypothetical protein